ncbi:unnamed protein product [Pedinophyceae sp. YPF-701]|nr:unnamed protein product [Pedinophyceae sp. YPF-701]
MDSSPSAMTELELSLAEEEEESSDEEEEQREEGERYLTEGALHALVRLDWATLAGHVSREPRADRAEASVDGDDGQARLYTARQMRHAWAVLTAPVRAMPGTKGAAAAPKNPYLPTWYTVEDDILVSLIDALLAPPCLQLEPRPPVKSAQDVDWQEIADRLNGQVARQLKEWGLDGQHPPRSAAAVRERVCCALDVTYHWLAHDRARANQFSGPVEGNAQGARRRQPGCFDKPDGGKLRAAAFAAGKDKEKLNKLARKNKRKLDEMRKQDVENGRKDRAESNLAAGWSRRGEQDAWPDEQREAFMALMVAKLKARPPPEGRPEALAPVFEDVAAELNRRFGTNRGVSGLHNQWNKGARQRAINEHGLQDVLTIRHPWGAEEDGMILDLCVNQNNTSWKHKHQAYNDRVRARNAAKPPEDKLPTRTRQALEGRYQSLAPEGTKRLVDAQARYRAERRVREAAKLAAAGEAAQGTP